MSALSAPQSPSPFDIAAEIAAGDALNLAHIARQYDVSPSTVFRWVMNGLPNGRGERVHLTAIKRGRLWLTSRAAIARFWSAMPQSPAAPTAPPIRTPAQRDRDTARAKQQLADRYGI